MASQDDLKNALVKAHEAGDTQAAQMFADMIKQGEFESPTQPITGRDLARSFSQGSLLGFGDEAQAKAFSGIQGYAGADDLPGAASLIPHVHAYRMLKGLLSTDDYETYRDQERADQARFETEHPVASLGSTVAGGIFSGITGGGVAPQLLRQSRNLPLVQRLGVASGTGAGGGAVAGLGEAESLEDAPGKMLEGAVTGAVTGPLFEGGISALQALKRPFSAQRAAERATRRAMRRGDMTLPEVKAKLKEMGPDAVLADVNEGLRGELDRIVNTPGTARTRAIKQLTKRSEQQLDEILGASGKGQYFENLEKTKAIKQNLASPLYESAFEKGVPHTSTLENIFETLNENVPGLWDKARRIGKLDAAGKGVELTEEMLTENARPSLRGWQSIKEALDDRISTLFRSGDNKEAGALKTLQKQLLGELDRLNPDYGTARGIWAGSKAFETSMDEGLKFMRPGMNASQLRQAYKKLSDVEQLGFREGARQSIQNVLETKGDTHDLSKFFKNAALRDKLRTVFGRNAQSIIKTIESSSAKQRTFAEVTGNSKTALRQAAQAEEGLMRDIGDISLEAFSTGGPSPTLARRMMNSIPTTRESTRNNIASMLLESDPTKQAQVVEWLLKGKPMPTTGAGLIPAGVAGGLGGLLLSE